MTEMLTDLLVNGITSHSSMLDSFVILNAALISALHKIVGVEFGKFYSITSLPFILNRACSGFHRPECRDQVRGALFGFVNFRKCY